MRLTSDQLEDLVAKQFGMKLVGWMFWNPETKKISVAWKVEDQDSMDAHAFFERGGFKCVEKYDIRSDDVSDEPGT